MEEGGLNYRLWGQQHHKEAPCLLQSPRPSLGSPGPAVKEGEVVVEVERVPVPLPEVGPTAGPAPLARLPAARPHRFLAAARSVGGSGSFRAQVEVEWGERAGCRRW